MFTCNDGVTLVVEGAEEDLASVPLQDLQAVSRVNIPQTSRVVGAGTQEPAALRAETDLPRAQRVVLLLSGVYVCHISRETVACDYASGGLN